MDTSLAASPLVESFFDAGEMAQVFAKDTRDGSIVILKQGEAEMIRAEAKEYFICPIEGCPNPSLETVGGVSGRRHHFRHKAGNGHEGSKESWFHLESKFLIGKWAEESAKQLGINVLVEVDTAFIGTREGGYRKPDVLVTHKETGKQIAFEIEYFNSTTPESLAARRATYKQNNVKDIWIFGHASKHIKPPKAGSWIPEGSIEITSVPAAIANSGGPILIINPIEGVVGTLIHGSTIRGEDWYQNPDHYGLNFASPTLSSHGEVRFNLLSDSILDPTFGILTNTTKEVKASRNNIASLAPEAKKKHEEKLARREQEKAKRVAYDALSKEEKDKKREYAERIKEEQKVAWQTHSLRLKYIQLSGKNNTPLVTREHLEKSDYGVMAYHEHWHTEVFERFLRTQEIGYVFTIPQVYAYLASQGIRLHSNSTYRDRAIVAYVEKLEAEGYLEIEYTPMGLVESMKVRHNSVSTPWKIFVEEMIKKDKHVPTLGGLCREVPDGTSIEEVTAYRDAMFEKYWGSP